jgi:hypothetical protein
LNPRVKPGAQGYIHFSIVADPNDANIVYVGGDRQDGPFPNFVGATNFTGRLFRGDTSVDPTFVYPDTPQEVPSPQWTPLTHDGTASNSAPHADSREMVFDAAGRLIEVDDGGIYYRTLPQGAEGDWFSIIGNLQVTEFHDIAYDANFEVLVGGTQDIGTVGQSSQGSLIWTTLNQGDGGDVAVDDVTLRGAGQSIVYHSSQNLGFHQTDYTLAQLVNRRIRNCGSHDEEPLLQFVTPVELNAIDRAADHRRGQPLYESLTRETLTFLDTPSSTKMLRMMGESATATPTSDGQLSLRPYQAGAITNAAGYGWHCPTRPTRRTG